MSKVVQTAKNLFAIPTLNVKMEQERRASVFGMVESGKTTILGLLEIICINLANASSKKGSKTKFRYLVRERTSGIRQAAAELRMGMFPEKTPPDHIFEADFFMRWDGLFKSQRILCLPFCETAGEAMGNLLDRFQSGQYDVSPDMEDAELIHNYILNTDALVLIAPVTRPMGLEVEKGAKLNLPDVNLSRLLEGVYRYKMQDALKNPNHRPIKGIAVFLTKYDAAEITLKSKQMDLKTREGVHDFMVKYFPETYAILGWYGLENVKFWPTGVSIETERHPETRKKVPKLHPLKPSRGWKIQVDHNRAMPEGDYEDQMHEFIEWLKDTVMA